MIGDEFKVWRKKPWYTRVKPYVYAAVLFGTFQAGQVYNAARIMDSVLPRDTMKMAIGTSAIMVTITLVGTAMIIDAEIATGEFLLIG